MQDASPQPSAQPRLRQINVSYVDKEDRLLLRVSTSMNAEYRLWCTRRFTGLLLDRFTDLFEKEVAVSAPPAPGARREVAQMKHDLAVSEEAFSRKYEAQASEFPLGESGLLVTTLKYDKLSSGEIRLQFTDGGEKGMGLSLSRELHHQLYELFRRAAEKAGWFPNPGGVEAPGQSTVVH